MSERFKQKKIYFREEQGAGKIKVSKLCELLNDHPYKEKVFKIFNIDDIKDEVIVIANVDVLYKRLARIKEDFTRFNISSKNKDIDLKQGAIKVKDINEDNPLIFSFGECVNDEGEILNDFEAYAIYDSKNTFFDQFNMAKYANSLIKDGLVGLAEYNLEYFKNLAVKSKKYDKHRSYRIVENGGEYFVRGITSITRYFEYGVEFTFVVAMLVFHNKMKKDIGTNFTISDAAVSESKLEIMVVDNSERDAGDFGKVSSTIKISTNDLGQGSLNFTKIIKIKNSVYLFPNSSDVENDKIIISHTSGTDSVLEKLRNLENEFTTVNEFIEKLKDIKSIRRPEELRQRIMLKLKSPRNPLSKISELKSVFSKVINDELSNFAKLLEMCGKAEELEIDYDMKEKLRYLISDVLLNIKR